MSTVLVQQAAGVKVTSMEGSSPAAGRIPQLDGLRGLAILLVILCHYVGNASHAQLGFWPHRFLSAFTAGWSGVDLFFVLSGFLIGGILLDARDTPNYFRTFYIRRVFRILPIYYLWTLLFGAMVIAALELAPGRLALTLHDLWRLPVQLFFLQDIFFDMPLFTWMWFAVTWSLAVEEQFYLLAPPLIRFITRSRLAITLAAVVFFAPILRLLVLQHLNEGSFLAELSMPCRADALACGILLAMGWREARFRELVRKNAAELRGALLVLLAGIIALLWWLVHPVGVVKATIGYSWLAIFYSVLLLVAVSQTEGRIAEAMRWRFLRWLGGISYCVYLLHEPFNLFAHRILLHAEPEIYDAKGVGVTLLALAATLAVASLSWRYFEKPLIRRGHSYSYEEAGA